MSTKHLIKTLKSSKDVQPSQIKSPKIKQVKVEDGQTVEDAIRQETERLANNNPVKRYLDAEVRRLRKQLAVVEENVDAIRENMEVIMIAQREILDFIEGLRKVKEEKPSKWKRLFK